MMHDLYSGRQTIEGVMVTLQMNVMQHEAEVWSFSHVPVVEHWNQRCGNPI
jgi:hypothetical protein